MPTPLSALFGRSPIRPIQEHMAKAQKCVILLGSFLEASFVKDWDLAYKIQQEIRDCENEADDLKSDIRTKLPKNLFLPVPRTDLLELLSTQDHLANRAKDIAGLMLGRKMEIPESLVEEAREYFQESLLASEQALKVINELDELLETGFRGKEVDLVESLIVELDALEHQTDISQIKLRAKLFQLEESLPAVHVMFLYKIIDLIGDLADISQKIGGRLLLLIAR
ncbi:MAG: TIGR00153 family protein [SAR86 cluster bacterium]|uniref:TIGR00153 family protein n=1 Tax=SAR86 cluster bacterium TaxID=2030880 RepID=A0A2A5AUL9_9GAMM|nr:MAG: TIGR00153 family protein [SAR86 cluster bacterium]